MYNYYNFDFNKKYLVRDSIQFYKSLPTKNLKDNLNKSFNYLEAYLIYFSKIFKNLYKEKDYDEFYYTCQSLVEELNDIKIILSILKEREKQ